MNKKRLTQVVVGIVLLLIIALVLFKMKTRSEKTEPVAQTFVKKKGGPCPGETKTFVMNDPYMRGVVEQGQKFNVILNYYDCNPVKDGDLVFYQMHHSMEPTVKFARGVGGDKFSLSKDTKYNAWNLKVNGELVRSKVDNIPYFFGAPQPPPLAKYEQTNDGLIKQGDVIILSSWPPGDGDSGTFGMFNQEDIVGKVELITSEPAPSNKQ